MAKRRNEKLVAPLSLRVQGRWQLATTMLTDAVKHSGTTFQWPVEVPGCLARDVTKVAKRFGGVSASMLKSILRVRWEGAKVGGDLAVLPLVRDVELALARFPLGIPAYLNRTSTTKLSGSESLGLVLVAWEFASNEEERGQLTTWIERAQADLKARGSESSKMNLPVAEFRTLSQERAFQHLLRLADLFFSVTASRTPLRIRPRLNPLVVGPSGVGKSHLVESVAKQLCAHFRRVSFSDWIPLGATHEYTPTLFSLMESAMTHERVVVFIDELDKLPVEATSAWARSCMLDLWQLLDRSTPVAAFQKYTRIEEASVVREEDVRAQISSRLWIVGAGTWQSLHRQNSSLGFSTRRTDDLALRRDIVDANVLPPELLLRFNPDFLHLHYPRSEDSQSIFDQTGITALAKSVGVRLDPIKHDWSMGGMRSLEDVATKLLLRQRELQHDAVAAQPPEQARVNPVSGTDRL